jgi:hypothetical protein
MPDSLMVDSEAIIFTILACGLILFSLFAVMSAHHRVAVANFLIATFFLSGIVILFGKTHIGIGTAILYSSLCSIFLIMSRMSNQRNEPLKYINVFLPILGGFLLFALLFYKLQICNSQVTTAILYSEIHGAVLSLYLIFIVVITGIGFCFKLKKV